MTPIEVKKLLREAVRSKNIAMAWPAVVQIVEQDMYINVPKPEPTEHGRMILSRWGNRPWRCGCGEIIKSGTKVWWEPNWGISIPEHVGR